MTVDTSLIEAIQTAVQDAMSNGPDRILKRPEVQETTGLSCAEIYRRMAKNDFPKPVKLGPKAVGWRMSDIQAWIKARKVAA